MTVTVSLINMKGGVGKTTLAFNLAWFSAWQANLRVLAVDLDPQANLSQYFMGAEKYLEYLNADKSTVVDIFEQFSAPRLQKGAPTLLDPKKVIHHLRKWDDGSLLDLIPSRLELSWTLKNPTEKAHLLPQFLAKISENYDLILIDCAPTESILTTAAYRSSRYVAVPVKPEFLATIGLPLLARSLEEFKLGETRYSALDRSDHTRSQHLLALAQADVDERWHYYEQLAGVERSLSAEPEDELGTADHEPHGAPSEPAD